MGRVDSTITFRAITEADLPLLHDWLCRPHVVEHWEPAPTFEMVREDYMPRLAPQSTLPVDAPAGVVQYLACEDGEPFGYVQAYRVMAHQSEGWWLDETDPNALGVDQFIGLPDRLGKGLGTRMMRAFIAFLFEDPRVSTVQTDPDPQNARAIACYRKAGFRDVGVVDTLDGPALLMRITRERFSPAEGQEG